MPQLATTVSPPVVNAWTPSVIGIIGIIKAPEEEPQPNEDNIPDREGFTTRPIVALPDTMWTGAATLNIRSANAA